MIYWMVQGAVLPAAMNVKSDKPLAQAIEAVVPSGPVYSYRPEAMWRYYVVNYYMHDRLRLFDVDMPEKGLLLVGEGDFQILKDGVGADYKFSDTKLLGCRSNETRQHTLLLEFERKHCAL